jgi:DNA-binding response OmpR family regulator
MRFVFMAHADETLLASDLEQARQYLSSAAALDLAICDVDLPDGTGLDVLEEVREMNEPRPAVVVVATHTSDDDRATALMKGARGYLGKPISYHDIIAVLKRSAGSDAPRAPRRRHSGRAYVLSIDDEVDPTQSPSSQLHLRTRDVSATGAFLETEAPLPIGSSVQLALDIGGSTVHVTGRIVRVQEPGWGLSGGVGVSFLDDDPAAAAALDDFVAGSEPDIH